MKPESDRISAKASRARNELIKSAETMLTLLDSNDRQYAAISSLHSRLLKYEFNLVIVGQFKTGKSTLANCFIHKKLLPSGVVPLTSVITEIRAGNKEEIEVHRKNGKTTHEPVERISSYVTEAENPKNRKNIEKIVLLCESNFFGRGMVLIDTPGIGSTFTHNTEVTKSFLPNCDAVIFVISSDSPLSTDEISLIIEAQKIAPKLFIVLNKSDHVSGDELGQLIRHIQRELEKHGIKQPVYPVSAKVFIESHAKKEVLGEARSAVPALEREIFSFLQNKNREDALLESARLKMCNASNSLYNVLSSELASLKNDIKTTGERIIAFEREAAKIRDSVSVYNSAIDDEFSFLLDDIIEDIEKVKPYLSKNISENLKRSIANNRETNNSRLIESANELLSRMIAAELSSWWKKEDAKIQTKTAHIGKRYSEMLTEAKSAVESAVSGIFYFHTKNLKTDCRLDLKTYFYFQVDGFSQNSWIPDLSLMLPNNMFRKKLLERVEVIVGEEVDKNCGRIRHDYLQKLNDGKAKFKGHLQSSVEEVISEIEEGLSKGRAVSLDNASARKTRLHEVERKLKTLSAI